MGKRSAEPACGVRPAMLVGAVVLSGMLGCSEPPPPPPPPPAQVRVADVIFRDVPITREWVGETKGQIEVDIPARVRGFLVGIHFTEGRPVTKGQLLYTIDQSELLEDVTTAEAELAAERTLLANAENDVRRFRPLAEINAVSRSDLDHAEAQEGAARSSVEAAEARLNLKRINLSYSEIRAPIDGLIGLTQAQVGDFVGSPPNSVVLNTVSQIDPIHVRFSISEREYLELARRHPAISAPDATPADRQKREASIELILSDGSTYAHLGSGETADSEIDSMTGTLAIEAAFPNPDGLLRPGQYGKVRAVVGTRKDALLVPQRAVQELQGRFLVWVVGDDETVSSLPVQPGPRTGDLWVIDEGLEPGMRIVVEGIQRLREGTKVAAQAYEPIGGGTDDSPGQG